jgi:membrane protease YdiL (CAAX protease family)
MNTRTKGIAVYLLIAFALAWIPWEIVIRLGISVRTPQFQLASLPSAFAPAFAAFIVRKWVTREGFADAGLRLNLSKWRYYLVGWLLPLVVVGCIVVLAPLLGLGRADLSMMRGASAILPPGTPLPHIPSLWISAAVLTFFAVLGAPVSFGEEFGWRSYLQLRLFPQQPILSAVVTGLFWSLWHFPVLVRGYAFPDNPYSGLIVFTISAVLLSIIFGWLRLKTASIWSTSLAHAATNAVGGNLTMLMFTGGASLIWVLDLGILAWIPLGALSAWIVFTGQLKPAGAPGLAVFETWEAHPGTKDSSSALR